MKSTESNHQYQPIVHRLTIVLALVVFPLIWVGGLVTTYDAGMAVPDWPTTYGDNMFTYSWSAWISSAFNGAWDLFIEHGHRLMGSLVGLLYCSLIITAVTHVSGKGQKRQQRP